MLWVVATGVAVRTAVKRAVRRVASVFVLPVTGEPCAKVATGLPVPSRRDNVVVA